MRYKRRNQIVAKNVIVISCSLIVGKAYYSKKSNYNKAIECSDMNSHVRWTMSRAGPQKKTLVKRDLYRFFKNDKKTAKDVRKTSR